VNALRAALEKSAAENGAVQLTANEAQRAAAHADRELASLRAELERQAEERNHSVFADDDNQDDPVNFQTAVELRIALAESVASRREAQAALDYALETSSQTASELAEARNHVAELEQANQSVREELESITRTASGSADQLEVLRREIQRIEDELSEFKNQRENETRTLTDQLERAAAEISQSAREIERLNSNLHEARLLAEAAVAAENGSRIHALSAHHEDLWNGAPSPDGSAESVTPVIMNADEPDEQKLLVDALLRFLGRR